MRTKVKKKAFFFYHIQNTSQLLSIISDEPVEERRKCLSGDLSYLLSQT